jgi:hypothetical protein
VVAGVTPVVATITVVAVVAVDSDGLHDLVLIVDLDLVLIIAAAAVGCEI